MKIFLKRNLCSKSKCWFSIMGNLATPFLTNPAWSADFNRSIAPVRETLSSHRSIKLKFLNGTIKHHPLLDATLLPVIAVTYMPVSCPPVPGRGERDFECSVHSIWAEIREKCCTIPAYRVTKRSQGGFAVFLTLFPLAASVSGDVIRSEMFAMVTFANAPRFRFRGLAFSGYSLRIQVVWSFDFDTERNNTRNLLVYLIHMTWKWHTCDFDCLGWLENSVQVRFRWQ